MQYWVGAATQPRHMKVKLIRVMSNTSRAVVSWDNSMWIAMSLLVPASHLENSTQLSSD